MILAVKLLQQLYSYFNKMLCKKKIKSSPSGWKTIAAWKNQSVKLMWNIALDTKQLSCYLFLTVLTLMVQMNYGVSKLIYLTFLATFLCHFFFFFVLQVFIAQVNILLFARNFIDYSKIPWCRHLFLWM